VDLFRVYSVEGTSRLAEARLDAASFANDAPEVLRYCSIVKRARVGLTHARDNVPFSLAIANWQASALLCSSSFDGQLGPAVKQVKQLAVDGVYQHSPNFNASLIAQVMILTGSR